MTRTEGGQRFWAGLCEAAPLLPSSTVTEWAKEHRVLSRGTTHKPGRFIPYPMQVAPMDDVTDQAVSEVIMCWAAQTAGKTETLFNIIGYFIHVDPSPILYVLPTDKLGSDYSKERLAPMIRDTPVLKELVRDPRTRDSGNTVLSKTFPGGSIALVGANAPAGLAGRPRRVILLDEVDRFPVSAGTEGDPCALADKRADSFPNAVKVKTSTPTVKGRSRIWSLLEQSDFQKWHARCPRCQAEQVFAWSQVGWPEDKPEEAWIECAGCKAKLSDEERVAAVTAGRWKATQPFRGKRGFWLNGINTLLKKHKGFSNRLHEMASDFLQAKAEGGQALRVWINTFLCECYEEEVDAGVKPDELENRSEDYTPDDIPRAVLMLVAGVDIQKDRIECEVVGYGPSEERWGIEKKVFDGFLEQDDVWKNLDEYLLKDFTRDDGLTLKIDRVFIDMGHAQKRVLEFCAPRLGRGVYPCKGINTAGRTVPPLLPAKPSRNNRARIPHWNVGVTVAKTTIYDRLPLPVPGARSMHFPKGYGYDTDHFRQLTTEQRKTRYKFGQAYSLFEKARASDRNEALDLAVYALAALHSLGRVNWAKLEENRKAAAPKPEGEEKEEAPPESTINVRQVKIPRRNWVTGGGRW